jgi:uncharacterized protein YbjQ (UPF0145 family)
MILSTTDSLQGYRVVDYLGIVVGQAVVSADFTKEFHTGIRNINTSGKTDYGQELHRARDAAREQLTASAGVLGADAVIGIDFDFETAGGSGHHVIVSMAGTAVRLSRE